MKVYTVIGIYPDNGQRFATGIEAKSPEDAEEQVLNHLEEVTGETLMIAGTIEGNHMMAS
jgi:predicted urease superfamily metal-dependent hydrolase